MLICLVLIFPAACSQEKIPAVDRNDLFTVEIGRMEDQIDLFNLDGDRSKRKTDIAMRDGLLYISNGNGGKVVRYNSYGDLLFMIYNDETNPTPLTLKPNTDSQGIVTRWSFPYPLMEPGLITVDSRKHIYVEDRVEEGASSFDAESRSLLDRVVLHFNIDGLFVNYLGQTGVGGTPFPNIIGLYTSVQNELAVVCRLPTGWNIYWFDAEGSLLYLVRLENDRIPVPPDRDLTESSLDKICISPDERKVYVKVDYYRNTYDESTNTRSGSQPDSSVIWFMNVEDGSYIGNMDIPFFESQITENNRRITENLFYSMIGVARQGRVFFSFPMDGGYSILICSTDSLEQIRGFIRVANEELQFNAFDLSGEGILSALLATEWQARLVWWRTDGLMEEGPL
ncbi:MAG: hypothetical protein LBU28_04330 [Spirochaetaceae bacterium]|jgi:hypothetical protein|nr:hypothetical protein [Spirochaetaceae bacterium]